jgi:hypothetical protein
MACLIFITTDLFELELYEKYLKKNWKSFEYDLQVYWVKNRTSCATAQHTLDGVPASAIGWELADT